MTGASRAAVKLYAAYWAASKTILPSGGTIMIRGVISYM